MNVGQIHSNVHFGKRERHLLRGAAEAVVAEEGIRRGIRNLKGGHPVIGLAEIGAGLGAGYRTITDVYGKKV